MTLALNKDGTIEYTNGRWWLKEYHMAGWYVLPMLGFSNIKGHEPYLGFLQIEAGWLKTRIVLNIQNRS